MGRIQSNVGLVTGLPIQDTVNQLMQLNSLSRNRLAARNTLLGQEQAALASLTTLVVGVQLTTDRLGQSSLFSATSVTSSSDAISARSVGNPQVGTYRFTPIRQAQSQQLTSGLYASAGQTVGEGKLTIHTGGFLDQSIRLEQLNGGSGVNGGFIRITDRSGTSRDIDLRFAQSAGDVVHAINSTESLSVVASMQGGRFVLTDVSGSSTHHLSVQEVGTGSTAHDLGLAGISVASTTATGANVMALSGQSMLRNLLDSRGLDFPSDGTALRFLLSDGSQVNFSTELNSDTATLGQLIDEINAASGGKLVVRIAQDGMALEFEDQTTGTEQLSVTSPSGNLAQQLGLAEDNIAGFFRSQRLQSGLNDTLLSSLNGGNGLGSLGLISITDRSGNTDSIDLSSAETLHDVIDALNTGADNASFRVQLNRTRTGIEIVDTSGGNGDLEIESADSNQTAQKLGIQATNSNGSIDSGSLRRQFVHRNTSIQEFLGGQSLSQGSFRITNSTGVSATFNVNTKNPKTMGDIIDGINSLGLGITASVNEAGDGIVLIDSTGGSQKMTVEDVGTGSAATQLRIAGTAAAIDHFDATVSGINGSRNLEITTTSQTTLSDLVQQINDLSGGPVNANLMSLGSSGVRLQINGRQSGLHSRVMIESTNGLALTQTSEARDALLSFGSSEAGGGVLVSSSTNRFSDLIEGLEINVTGTSTNPVTVEVKESSDGLSRQIETFVEQYNKLRDKYNELTAFNAEKNEIGLLFGSNVALRLEMAFTRLMSSSSRSNQAGAIRSLPEIGVRLNESGKLTFDKQQFEQVRAANPQAVKEFFVNESNGFSKRAKDVSDSLAGVQNGTLLARNNALQQSIDQNASRIASMDIRLEQQRNRLLQQFYGLEQAISKLQSNMTAINQLQVISWPKS